MFSPYFRFPDGFSLLLFSSSFNSSFRSLASELSHLFIDIMYTEVILGIVSAGLYCSPAIFSVARYGGPFLS